MTIPTGQSVDMNKDIVERIKLLEHTVERIISCLPMPTIYLGHKMDMKHVPGETEFITAFQKCLAVFRERYEKYGNHLEKDKFEDVAGLYIKASRMCRDIPDRKELNEDTLIDLVNYALQILSRKELSDEAERPHSDNG